MRISELTEHEHQAHLMLWAKHLEGRWPALRLLYAIPNAGKRTKAARGKLKAEGMKAGVPDLCLPVPRCGYHGLYIELKRDRDARPTKLQREWLQALREQGNKAVICHGWENAAKVLQEYVAGAVPKHPLSPSIKAPSRRRSSAGVKRK